MTDSELAPSAPDHAHVGPQPSTRKPGKALALTALTGVAVGGFAAGGLLTIAGQTADLENIGQYVQEFVRSPGLGGLAALGAAIIAFQGIRGQIKTSRDALEHQRMSEAASQWWNTFQWTADRALPSGKTDVPLPQDVAVATLTKLATTTANPAQQIACGGLVDVLGESIEEALDQEKLPKSPATYPGEDAYLETDAERQSGKGAAQPSPEHTSPHTRISASALPRLARALSEYASATDGSPAASAAANRLAYERRALKSLESAASELGLDLRTDVRFVDHSARNGPGMVIDATVSRPDGFTVLVEVASSPRDSPVMNDWFLRVMSVSDSPLIVISPSARPSGLPAAFYPRLQWVQWKSGVGQGPLREALLRALP